jgi:hypothetical protein
MNMNFTKEEYAALLKSIFMAEWLVTAVDVGTDPAHEPFTSLFQKIYDSAKDMGCEEWVDYFPAEKRFYPADALWDDAVVKERIDHYNTSTFWEELISRMSERDLERQGLGLTQSGPMSDAQIVALTELEAHYSQAFEQHGLSKLIISQ